MSKDKFARVSGTTPEKGGNRVVLCVLALIAAAAAVLGAGCTASAAHVPIPTVEMNTDSPTVYVGYYFGTYTDNGQTNYASAINGQSFESKNKDCTVPTIDEAHESQFDTLYTQANANLTAAFLVDQNYLMKYFNAAATKGGTFGTLADGTSVELTGNVWVIHQDNAPDLVFNPLVLSQAGKPFGYPVICEQNQNGQKILMTVLTDGDGNSINKSSLHPAFQSASTIAEENGYMGDNSNVYSIAVQDDGQMALKDKKGNLTGLLNYAKVQSVASEPTAESTEVQPAADLGNLEDPSTWPTNYEGLNIQDYWAKTDFSTNGRPDQDQAIKEDQIFDDFVNASMKKTLTESGVDTTNLTNDQLFAKYIEWGNQNKEVLTISPQRLRSMVADINNYMTVSYTDNDGTAHMGIYAMTINSNNVDFPPIIRNALSTVLGTLDLNIFRINNQVPQFMYHGVYGYLSLFRFPQLDEKTEAIGALASYPDYQDSSVIRYFPTFVNYQPVKLPKNSIVFGQNATKNTYIRILTVDDTLPQTIYNKNHDGKNKITFEELQNLIGQPALIDDNVYTANGASNIEVFPYQLGIPQTYDIDPR